MEADCWLLGELSELRTEAMYASVARSSARLSSIERSSSFVRKET